ncbi:rRNA maturation RNase YbeY [Xanthovirga aplysinae]|uniref:rRNA maturation RNase YbeY n=1 Tax=Xanthovirga aplysinae TaxID=2529853 RepID=UPI0012BCAF32|nr:rRNA maturation RNase YbeY [Xanthovirga aplysinae]MTI30291.1 rRNA maturation RNase YbeY [Xanthovirga aplysinae]
MASINFFNEDLDFDLENSEKTRRWIQEIIKKENFVLNELNFVFCSDNYLHTINMEYLDHDTYTDIITFDNSEIKNEIEGDIFISVERVRENAKSFKRTFTNELHRVIIHGVLHLLGYKDKTEEEATLMRKKEDESLNFSQF